MRTRTLFLLVTLLLLALAVLTAPCKAELTGANTVDQLIQQFQNTAQSWQNVILNEARALFGWFALISFVLGLGLLVAFRLELGEIVASLIRWALFTSIAWWGMVNGPEFTHNLVDSFYQLAGQASGQVNDLTPTAFIDLSLGLYQKVQQQEHWYTLGVSIGAELVAILIIIIACCITANLVQVLCSAWIFSAISTIFLAFGGLLWTRDIAINFYRTVLGIAAKVMVMVLIMGIGYQFLKSAAAAMTVSPNGGEMVVFLAASLVLALLSVALPNLAASVMGGPGAAGLGTFGLGAGLAAASMMGSVVIRGIQAAGKATDGGMSALEKAVQKAEATLAGGGGKAGRNGNGSGVSSASSTRP